VASLGYIARPCLKTHRHTDTHEHTHTHAQTRGQTFLEGVRKVIYVQVSAFPPTYLLKYASGVYIYNSAVKKRTLLAEITVVI
jgi:hypothetical protein